MDEPTRRKPVDTNDSKIRIVSFPNGLWQAQEHIGRSNEDDRRCVDTWHGLHRPSPWKLAEAWANSRVKP